MSKHTETAGQYPVIPLRTEVQLPGHVGPLEIGREASVRAIEAATRDDNLIVIIPQKNPAFLEPYADESPARYRIGAPREGRIDREAASQGYYSPDSGYYPVAPRSGRVTVQPYHYGR